jgi:hypothetical protein
MWRRLALATIGGLVLVIFIGTWWHFAWAKRVAAMQRRNTGRLLADQAILLRHWENLEERSVTGGEAGNDFLEVIHDLREKLNSQDHDSRLIFPAQSPLYRDREGQPEGEFQQELLKRLAQTRPQEPDDVDWAERVTPDGRGYEYYQAVRAQASCLALCHSPPDATLGATPTNAGVKPLREGDLMAVVQVSMPNSGLKRR